MNLITSLNEEALNQLYPIEKRKSTIYNFSPYGLVRISSTGNVLHKLEPILEKELLEMEALPSYAPLPKFETIAVSGTQFQKRVWEAAMNVPFGKTVSYGDIAKIVGSPKGARAVGTALGSNKIGIIIPCHRVLRKSGEMGGFGWGLDLKKKWIELEKSSS